MLTQVFLIMKEKEKIDNMKIFSWQAKVGGNVIADGYLLAKDRKEAEEKLKYVPYHDTHEVVELDDDDCGHDGKEINEKGIVVRWFD